MSDTKQCSEDVVILSNDKEHQNKTTENNKKTNKQKTTTTTKNKYRLIKKEKITEQSFLTFENLGQISFPSQCSVYMADLVSSVLFYSGGTTMSYPLSCSKTKRQQNKKQPQEKSHK